MLSSLGARRDRSPTGRQPPRKVFVQEQEVSKPDTQPQPVPMIVVQECQEKHQSEAAAKSDLRKESVEDLPHQSKREAHAQPQVLPEITLQDDVVGAMALGEPKRQKISDDKETMESQAHYLDIKPTSEQIQQTPTCQQPLAQQQEPTQLQMQLDTQHQTQQAQQKQVQIQKQGTSQQQTLFQQSVKVRKSQKHAENRPWLQQKSQGQISASVKEHKVCLEVAPQPKVIATTVCQPLVSISEPVKAQAKVTWTLQQQPITTSVASQVQVSTTDADQVQTRVTLTQAKVTQAQQQQSVLQAKVIQAQQQQPMTVIATAASQPMVSAIDSIQSEPKSVIQTQFQMTQVQQHQYLMQAKVGEAQQVIQAKVVQVQQEQPVTQAKLGQVHQQHPISQMRAKEQVPVMAPVTSQKQPQALTVQQHPQPFTATSFTQLPTKQSEIQTSVMAQTQPTNMAHTYQYLPVTGEERQAMRQPPAPVQPQIITQRQPRTVATQSPPQQAVSTSQPQGITITQAQPKSTAPIQPRIISMPQTQLQFYKPPLSPPQVMGMGQTYDNIQLRLQSHIQQPQWRPVMPDIRTQSYHEAPNQGFMPSDMPPQAPFHSHSHPQSQGVTQPPAQPQQWAPLRGGLVTQTCTSAQGTGHVQPYRQSQGYSSPQPQSQQWGQFRSEPTLQPYSQISPQSPVKSFVPSQHWQPVRQSDVVRHGYPQVQMSEYPQAQHQVTPRPQSPPQQWPMQAESQSQVQYLKMFPQPVAHTPWVQPSSHTSGRPQGPAPHQSQVQQQQWPQNRPEVQLQDQIWSQTLQSQTQLQVLQKLQMPEQEQPQQQLVAQAKSPTMTPVRPQGVAHLQPQIQQQWPQNKTEAPFQIQIQSQTLQTQPQPQALLRSQLPEQEQPQQQSLSDVKPPAVAPVRPQGPAQQQTQTQQQQWAQNRAETSFQVQILSQTLQTQPQLQTLQKSQSPEKEQPQQHLVAQVKPPAQAQSPPQDYSETYAKAQALARTKFEDSKHFLQEHILEAINKFSGKKISEKQVIFKEVCFIHHL